MGMPKLPFDLAGCKVSQVKWPARGFQMVLADQTAEGRSVAGALLTFSAVANQYELRDFLTGKRRLERKGGVTRNTIDRYPLQLPVTLTQVKTSRATRASYGDAAFTDAHGQPPTLGPKQHLCLFALAEKRFKGRKPFPIIFERLSLADRRGKPLCGTEPPPTRRWSSDEYQRLGMRFFEAVVTDELTAAWDMLSKACRKRLGRAEFKRRLGDYRGWARRFGQALDQLRSHLYVNVEDDTELVWESVQNAPADFPRGSARAQLALCSEFSREELFVYVVEEDGEPHLDLGEPC
jgi:hypothetical protein